VTHALPSAVHVDLDAYWAIRRCYDDAQAQPTDDDPVYDEGLPALLELFRELALKATFFAVGSDALIPARAALLRRCVEEGHEVANHSHLHRFDLGTLGWEALAHDVDAAHAAIEGATGVAPVGFRAPGYTYSDPLMRVLAARGYRYDSSILPTWAGPALRLADAYIRAAWPKRHQYGSPLRAFGRRGWHRTTTDKLIELPVLVSHPWRLPMQAGLLMLRDDGERRLATTLQRLSPADAPAIFLLHGIDATPVSPNHLPLPPGGVARRGARFFAMPHAEKMRRLRSLLISLRENSQPGATLDYLSSLPGA